MSPKLEIPSGEENGTLGELEPLQTDLEDQSTAEMKHSKTLIDNGPDVRS